MRRAAPVGIVFVFGVLFLAAFAMTGRAAQQAPG